MHNPPLPVIFYQQAILSLLPSPFRKLSAITGCGYTPSSTVDQKITSPSSFQYPLECVPFPPLKTISRFRIRLFLEILPELYCEYPGNLLHSFSNARRILRKLAESISENLLREPIGTRRGDSHNTLRVPPKHVAGTPNKLWRPPETRCEDTLRVSLKHAESTLQTH